MNKDEIEVGKVYWAKHNGQECRVRLDSIDINKVKYGLGLYGSGRTVTRYRCTKLSTSRAIVFKSAKKFIKEATA